jgi:hypothetical protein
MKFKFQLIAFLTIILGLSSPGFTDEEPNSEITSLEQLITATQKSLDEQKELLDLIKDYKESHQVFAQDSNNKKKASQMIEKAHLSYNFIQDHYLPHLFPSEFIKELKFFSQFASPTEISTP